MDKPRSHVGAILRRLRRLERREVRDLRRWLETTTNLLHVSVLVFVPLVIGLVTYLSNTLDLLPFLLFPPLASGTYTLFANPGSRYASPQRFVGGMTAGAVCGWLALAVTARYWYRVAPASLEVHSGAAAFGILLTGVVTWALDIEEPQAFSTALLVLVTGVTQAIYVISVFLSSVVVAGAFVLWRREVYERRAEYLYGTTSGDDHVLVPFRGDDPGTVATFAARLAAAHEAGKVVLLDLVPTASLREAEAAALETNGAGQAAEEYGPDDGNAGEPGIPEPAREAADRLEREADRVRREFDVVCEPVVATDAGAPGRAVRQAARETGCDLVVTPYEAEDGRLAPFVQGLFAAPRDVIVLRASGERDEWRNVLVPVRRTGDVAHAMLDFAGRLAGEEGRVTACHCIDAEGDRRRAEEMLANLVETFDRAFETRVARTDIGDFLEENQANYDLTMVGSSRDRSAASRFLSPPTFHRLQELDEDVAIVHRG